VCLRVVVRVCARMCVRMCVSIFTCVCRWIRVEYRFTLVCSNVLVLQLLKICLHNPLSRDNPLSRARYTGRNRNTCRLMHKYFHCVLYVCMHVGMRMHAYVLVYLSRHILTPVCPFLSLPMLNYSQSDAH